MYDSDGAKLSAFNAWRLRYWVDGGKNFVVDKKRSVRGKNVEINKPLKRVSGFLTL